MKKLLVTALLLMFVLSLPALGSEEEITVSTLFFEEDIREALTELSLQTGVNIIFDDTVRGTVTLDLDGVSLEKALDKILISGGYEYREIDGYYLVGLPDRRSKTYHHFVESETFSLGYLTVKEAEDLLPAYYDDYLRFNRERNAVSITAPRNIIERFEQDLLILDTPVPQVKIQMLVTEISREGLRELGSNLLEIDWEAGQELETDWEAFFGLQLGQVDLGLNAYGDLLSSLRILKGDKMASIEADPWVQVRDGEKAELFVGEEKVVLLEPEESSTRLERINIGVALGVTPRVIGGEKVEIKLSPDISHYSDKREMGFTVRRSQIDTTVLARDGQTLVVAGMTQETESLREEGVPFLRRLPLLRYLFGYESDAREERELLIFITPEIINPGRD